MAKKSPSIQPILWTSVAVLFVLVVAAILAGSLWVSSYLRSEQFRKLVAEKTGTALHADVTYGPLNWTGGSAYSDSMEATGTPGSSIDKIQADQIRADINWRSILQGAWRIDQIDVVRMEGSFRPAAPVAATESGGAAGAPSQPPAGIMALLPRRFELGQLNVSEANFQFKNAAGLDAATANKCSLNLQPDGPGWTASGNGGTLSMPGIPQLDVVNFRLRQQTGRVFVTDSNFRLGETGKISASGEFGDGASVRIEWQQVDIAQFLNAEWKNRLSGMVAGNATVELPATGYAFSSTGHFVLSDGLLQNIPMFEQVSSFTGAPEFRRMPLQEVSGDYTYSGGTLTVTNFVMESKGLMRVEGNVRINTIGTPVGDGRVAGTGTVDGTFRIGVTPQTLQWLPGSREHVFTLAENGYVWTNLRVGGTLQNMQEDLSTRLVMAMKSAVIDQGVKAIENAPGGAVQGAQGVLNALTPLLK